MSDSLVFVDDDDLEAAARGFEEAAQRMEESGMAVPLGEVRGLTSLETRFSDFLTGIDAARRALGESAHVGARAIAVWVSDGDEIDAELAGAFEHATRPAGHG